MLRIEVRGWRLPTRMGNVSRKGQSQAKALKLELQRTQRYCVTDLPVGEETRE